MLISFNANNLRKLIGFAEQEKLRSLYIDGTSGHISYSLTDNNEQMTPSLIQKICTLKDVLEKLAGEVEKDNMPIRVSISFCPYLDGESLKLDIVWNNESIVINEPEKDCEKLILQLISIVGEDPGKAALNIPGIVRYGQGKKKGTVGIIDALQMIKELL